MTTEAVSRIAIDSNGFLRVTPKQTDFSMIYRSASEIHWDPKEKALHSPKPKEWDYTKWFDHIVSVVLADYGIKLVIANSTVWENIDDNLKAKITAAQ